MLFHRPRADVQFSRDLLVAAALHQQLQDLLIARCNLEYGSGLACFLADRYSLLRDDFESVAIASMRSNLFAKAVPPHTKETLVNAAFDL